MLRIGDFAMTDTPTQTREKAIRLAAVDTDEAYKLAVRIDDDRFRCQALAWIARFAPDDRFDAIVCEALQTAQRAKDPFIGTSSAAWPLRAMIERQRAEQTRRHLDDFLMRVPHVEPASSRSESFFLLFQAVFPGGQTLWEPVLRMLVDNDTTDPHWRQLRNTRDAILMAAGEDRHLANELVHVIPAGGHQRRLEQQLEQGDSLQPRPFFWPK